MLLDDLPLALIMEEILEWEKPKKGQETHDPQPEPPTQDRNGTQPAN